MHVDKKRKEKLIILVGNRSCYNRIVYENK